MKQNSHKKLVWWRRWQVLIVDKFIQRSLWVQILWIIAISLLFFWLGMGCTRLCNHESTIDMYDIFVQSVDPSRDFIEQQNPTPSFWGEILGGAIYLIGSIIVSGLLVTIIINSVDRRKESWLKGDVHYRINRNFVVIIGGHEMVPNLCRRILDRNNRPDFIIIQSRRIAESLRKEISALIEPNDRDRIIIYNGSRTSEQDLSCIKLECADEIFVIGENSRLDKDDHDTQNLECLKLIDQITKGKNHGKKPRIACHVMFEYQSTFAAFQFTDLSIDKDTAIDFIPFNFYEVWAQQMMTGGNCAEDDSHRVNYKPLYDTNNPERAVHLIVVGMSKMGIAMALEAAHVCHFPNFNENPKHPRTRITFIDANAEQEMYHFKGRYKAMFDLARWRFAKADDDPNAYKAISPKSDWHNPLNDIDSDSPYKGGYLGDNFIDIEWEFLEGNVAQPSIQKYIKEASADNTTTTTIAICLPASPAAISSAIYLPDSVYIDAHQILVQLTYDDTIISSINRGINRDIESQESKYCNVYPFGMTADCDYLASTNILLAKLVNYGYCKGGTDPTFSSILSHDGSDIHTLWNNDNPQKGKSIMAKRWSNIYHANSIASKKDIFGIKASTTQPDASVIERMAVVEHNRWNIEQLLLGFRPTTPEEDNDLKTGIVTREMLKCKMVHPDLRHFACLNTVSQEYDRLLSQLLPIILLKEQELQKNE